VLSFGGLSFDCFFGNNEGEDDGVVEESNEGLTEKLEFNVGIF
jgi:hypothetical protein